MNESQRDLYAAALRAKQAELFNSLNRREGLAAQSEPDLFDEIQRAVERALVIETLDRNSSVLRDVQSALERLAHGSYGQCLACEGPISSKRLAAVPWARYCLNCQEHIDRMGSEQSADVDFPRAA